MILPAILAAFLSSFAWSQGATAGGQNAMNDKLQTIKDTLRGTLVVTVSTAPPLPVYLSTEAQVNFGGIPQPVFVGTAVVANIGTVTPSVTVTPGTGTWTTSSTPPAGFTAVTLGTSAINQLSFTVTPGSGTWTTSSTPPAGFTAITLGTSTINQQAFTVTPGTGSWTSAPVTVTPGTGTFPISGTLSGITGLVTVAISSAQAAQPVYISTSIGVGYVSQVVTVTPGTGTFNTSASPPAGFTAVTLGTSTINQQAFTVTAGSGNFVSMSVTVTPGTGTWNTSASPPAGFTAVTLGTSSINQQSFTVTPGSGAFQVAVTSVVYNQVDTFIAYATFTASAGAGIVCFANQTGSTKLIKILRVTVKNASEVAVTGIPTLFRIHKTTHCALGITGREFRTNIATMTNTQAALDSNVSFSTGNPTSGYLSPPFSSVVMSSEETALTFDGGELYLYDFPYQTPLTLQPGSGVRIIQGALASTAGNFGVRILFTQQ